MNIISLAERWFVPVSCFVDFLFYFINNFFCFKESFLVWHSPTFFYFCFCCLYFCCCNQNIVLKNNVKEFVILRFLLRVVWIHILFKTLIHFIVNFYEWYKIWVQFYSSTCDSLSIFIGLDAIVSEIVFFISYTNTVFWSFTELID